MDQQKIGKFIAKLRKEKGLTQRELAEKLLITEKSVSKWECGKCLPDVSTMIPLCKILQISVNELLSGEKIEEKQYKQLAEENLLKQAKKEEQDNKLKLFSSIAIGFSGAIIFVLCAFLCEFELPLYAKVLLIVFGSLIFITNILLAIILDIKVGAFECRKCHHKFIPTFSAYIWGMHIVTTRYLKCPHCGKKSFCKRRLNNKKTEN